VRSYSSKHKDFFPERRFNRGKNKKYARLYPPTELYNEFFLDGKCRFFYDYENDGFAKKAERTVHNKTGIRKAINAAIEGRVGWYPQTDKWLYGWLSNNSVQEKVVAVVGSDLPWYEAILLSRGAKFVVGVSEFETVSEDERIIYKPIDKIKDECIDVVLSVGWINQYGLGRWGERLDANGDIKMMKSVKRICKDGGLFILGVPSGDDMIVWNKGRVYGKERTKMLVEGWSLQETIGWDKTRSEQINKKLDYIPLMILKKV